MRLLHIGRATSNDIVISDQTVSRQHAQLIIDDLGQVTFVDLNSANGSFVNGKRVTDPRRLDPTDIVKVGEYMLPWRNYLQASVSAATPATSSTQVGGFVQQSAPAQVAPADSGPAPADNLEAPRKPIPWMWIGLGAAALVLVIILIVMLTGGGASVPAIDGKWVEVEDSDSWINFGPEGKYTEGYKKAVTYDSASWKVMGVDRILIEKGDLEISRNFKMEGEKLKVTQAGKPTLYRRED
jgi:FHA domain